MISGVFVLPSLITAANMGLGVYSMAASIRGEWHTAAWCTIVSILLDILDGRVARWTGSSSRFGVEFDSLADLVSFGIAPAFMMYLLVLKDYGRIGFALTVLYIICGALRLAKFNLKALAEEESSPYFIGLPIPAAGGILASFVILYDIWSGGKKARTIALVMKQIPIFFHLLPGIIFVLSVLMVSGLRYSSLKRMNLFKPRSLRAFLIMVLVCLMIYAYPQNTLFVVFVGYIASGIIEYLWRTYRLRRMAASRGS
ncbi:MAG: CDP-diacylglycerol--serine O-phosphatidyltransferase [Elusimicrobia bacterium RIFCSPLOWO2_01_FULL_64_13]|nr:MAG: CDP-diacylglycerol--serine O-phosphatidyltransferase [Elusimicrobia bacterium RIFCSPHIGHO2_01_FULL_64_10]OGR95408.1 MAG: CDP-diacylglycerol--serine O-phosphatidyltransferase [Elusimicrobia bacterium RIFCSPLOWO2_01_FULL_64_13]